MGGREGGRERRCRRERVMETNGERGREKQGEGAIEWEYRLIERERERKEKDSTFSRVFRRKPQGCVARL